MRHLKSGSKLGRNPWHRRATLRNLVTNLFEHGRITTTLTRAKAARPVAEKMITLGKRENPPTPVRKKNNPPQPARPPDPPPPPRPQHHPPRRNQKTFRRNRAQIRR